MNKDVAEGLRQSVSDPVPDEATVLRRIHKNDVDPSMPFQIQPRAFRPSLSDTDGLSVYLDNKHGGPTPYALAASSRGGPENYLVVSFRVGELRNMGLNVVANENPDGLPGHAVIPELNVTDYQADKQSKRIQKVLQMKLCELARSGVVYPPDFPCRVNH